MNELVKYDAACRALADAVSIDEVKEFRDQSEALRAYAKQAKNKQLEIQAAEIRIRAERRIGELMAAQRDSGAMSEGGRPSDKTGSQTDPVFAPPTLAEVGIDKHLADRARKYAAIPEVEFDGIVGDWRKKVETENQKVTVNLLAAGEKAQQSTPAHKPYAPDPHAKLRAEYRKLTDEAREDDWINLRLEITEAGARIAKQRSQISDLKQTVKDLSEGSDMGAKISRLMEQLGAAKFTRDEAMRKAKAMEYRLKQAEKRADQAEEIEIPYA